MPLVTWTDSYSVNVTVFDKHHQHLFSLLNDLHDAMLGGRGKDVLQKTIAELVSYTQNHFTAEEAALKRTGYPDLERHRAEHQRFAAQVQQFATDFASGKAMLTLEVLNFLRQWLQNHIVGTDQRYGAHLNRNAIQ